MAHGEGIELRKGGPEGTIGMWDEGKAVYCLLKGS